MIAAINSENELKGGFIISITDEFIRCKSILKDL